jgi:hypothetical protein
MPTPKVTAEGIFVANIPVVAIRQVTALPYFLTRSSRIGLVMQR